MVLRRSVGGYQVIEDQASSPVLLGSGYQVIGYQASSLVLLGLRRGLLPRLAGTGGRGLPAGLLRQQDGLDVGQHASLGDGHSAEQLVELLVVPYRQLEVAGDDARLLVVPRSVAGQLQDLGGEVFQHGGHVNRGSGAHSMGIVTLPQETVDAADGELQPGPGAAGLGLGAGFASGLSSSRHFRC